MGKRRVIFLSLTLLSFSCLLIAHLSTHELVLLDTSTTTTTTTTTDSNGDEVTIVYTNITTNYTWGWGYDGNDGDDNDDDDDGDDDGDGVVTLPPERWSVIAPLCNADFQSPINIATKDSVFDSTLPQLKWTFDPAPRGNADPVTTNTVDNVIRIDNYYSQISFWDEVYELDFVEFHTKAAHQLNGVEYALELDAYHVNDDGKVLGIAFLFARDDSKEDWFINAVQSTFLPWQTWNESISVDAPDQIVFQQFLGNISSLMPGSIDYYRYYGSIMQPPCTPSVDWLVAVVPYTVSIRQINIFLAITGQNNRPIQTTDSRPIFRNFDFRYRIDKAKVF